MRLLLALLIAMLLASCGGNARLQAPATETQQPGQFAGTFPAALPQDAAQPWEELDADGLVIPLERDASAINGDSEFIPGVERFTESGDVTDNGEASRIQGEAGQSAHALYRLSFGGEQPGVVSVDANLLSGNGYYIGLSNYGSGRWDWQGPFRDNHVRLSTAQAGPWTSTLGNLFVAVLVHGAASLDCVGIAANLQDVLDSEAPPVPTGLEASPSAGGLLLGWDPVFAGDLAGYRIYSSDSPFSGATAAGVELGPGLEGYTDLVFLPADSLRHVRISAVDISGNESALSDSVSAEPGPGSAPELTIALDSPSTGLLGSVSLSVSGADSYDFDTDGDGIYEITGDTTGSASVDTSTVGLVRPRVRGTTGTEAVALGSLSVLVTGNSRPVAVANAIPASGTAPLEVSFSGSESTDFDGSIVGGGWDFDGDGIYDVWDDTDIVHVTAAANTYTDASNYNAKLRVLDDGGAWDVDTVSILVTESETQNQLPTADLVADATSGNVPFTVNFNAGGSGDPDGSIVEYAWDWDGDGLYDAVGESATVAHVYTTPGAFNARVRVEDDRGGKDSAILGINVNVGFNVVPNAVIKSDRTTGIAPYTIEFDGTDSSDFEGPIAYYEWDFDGDGNYEEGGTGGTAQYTYPVEGQYLVTLRVTDGSGAQDTDSLSLTLPSAWPTFGANRRNTGHTLVLGAQSNGLQFSYTSGDDIAGSAVTGPDNSIYFGSNDGKLYALAPNGNLKWTFQTGSIIEGSPAVAADGTVYVGSSDFNFYAVDPAGNLVWDYATGGKVRSTPVVALDGTVLFGNDSNKLFALNPDGSQKWNVQVSQTITASPAIANDGTIYFGSWNGRLYSINPFGSLNWYFQSGDSIKSAPAIDDGGRVLFGSDDGKLYCLNPNGTQAWNYTTGATITASPAIAPNGAVVFASQDNKLRVLDDQGNLFWDYAALGPIHSSPVLGRDNTIYFGSNDSFFYAVTPNIGLKWFYDTPAAIRSGPSIGSNGAVYFGCDDNKLYSVWQPPG